MQRDMTTNVTSGRQQDDPPIRILMLHGSTSMSGDHLPVALHAPISTHILATTNVPSVGLTLMPNLFLTAKLQPSPERLALD